MRCLTVGGGWRERRLEPQPHRSADRPSRLHDPGRCDSAEQRAFYQAFRQHLNGHDGDYLIDDIERLLGATKEEVPDLPTDVTLMVSDEPPSSFSLTTIVAGVVSLVGLGALALVFL